MQHWYKNFIQCFLLGMVFALCCRVTLALPNQEGIQVYQKNVHLSPERKQSLADDIDRYHNADNIWDVLRQEFILEHHENNVLVQEQIDWFMNHQDFLYRSITRAAPYLYYILQQVHLRHLPAEVVLLPVFESSYDPFAYSPQGAAGIWQMMPDTATGYGIKHNRWYDGRRDVIASTKAALNYLSYLGSFFDNNWLLAFAAYDTGEGNVLSAIRKNVRDGGSTDYWSLQLSQETRIYVPRLLALATIVSHPEIYPVYLPPVRNAPYLAQMEVDSQIALKHAANLAGLSMKRIMQLNPGYSHAMTDPNTHAKLVLPIENVEQFSENLAKMPFYLRGSPGKKTDLTKEIMASEPQPIMVSDDDAIAIPHFKHKSFMKQKDPSSDIVVALQSMQGHYSLQPGDTIYMARAGDSVGRIAEHFHISPAALQLANKLSDGEALHSGDKLIIPTHMISTQFAKVADSQYTTSAGETIYTVKQGESMDAIAKKFHTSPPAIRVVNLLASDEVHDGDKLLIPARG